MSVLSIAEMELYGRHLTLAEIGEQGQQKLKQASVLVVGAGGLGCPILQYLAAAGVGKIGIVDHDCVEKSNLQRQVLFRWQDIGKSKAEIAKERISALNPFVKVKAYQSKFGAENASELVDKYDIIADATDNFTAKYLINDACYLYKKILIYASINQFEGQLAVFNVQSPNYRDLFPEPPPPHLSQNCAEAGVMGVLPGLLGCLQANEIIKLITGAGEVLLGQLLLINILTLESRKIKLKPNQLNALSGKHPTIRQLEERVVHCPLFDNAHTIYPHELHEKLMAGKRIFLIDVRNPHEHCILSLMNDTLIPLSDLDRIQTDMIPADRLTVVYCQSGRRSQIAVKKLQMRCQQGRYAFLAGGLDAYVQAGYTYQLKRPAGTQ